ncbi:MAG: UvrD-helicase domain-containing protein, partial [Deltaproteobacteria bacterium]|nr:UvrD-helicase domain-containing protein [Deltaproteobacteria bacterium]
MQRFRADLHIHSRFSRGTSKRLNAVHLAAWGRLKGLDVLGTGDFTHPAWRDELREQLVEDEASGLYRLRHPPDLGNELPEYDVPDGDGRGPLFVLQAEISSIYKKDGAVRKVHNLVFLPDFASADRLCRKLAAVGNLHADGRPILGLDSRHLLEMVLETDNRGVLIPAHIWTPWFSLFGSRSGFDALEACFGDLSRHIFALETGLSSDPEMNRLWSALDRYALVSNSDCHSGENLGREANVFAGLPSYDGMFEALRRAARNDPPRDDCRFLGTLEFFPEEGKYHLDGHRACNVVLDPEQTRRLNGLCPVCGKPLTVGVLHRVRELADRTQSVPPPGDPGFASLIPLPELLAELLGVGPKSAKVRERHSRLLGRFGDELGLLMDVPEADLRQHWDALGEAVARMRRGQVIRHGGYDGEYGVVQVFDEEERQQLHGGRLRRTRAMARAADAPVCDSPSGTGDEGASLARKSRRKAVCNRQASLLPAPQPAEARAARPKVQAVRPVSPLLPVFPLPAPVSFAPGTVEFTTPQLRAIKAGPHPVLIVAGPGAGKTRVLVGRLVRLLGRGAPASSMVAVTFTCRAAAELRERLALALPPAASSMGLPQADTLHALALRQWPGNPLLLSEDAARA